MSKSSNVIYFSEDEEEEEICSDVEEEEDDLFFCCDVEKSSEDVNLKKEIISTSSIPREVFEAMNITELIGYILEKDEIPITFDFKELLIEQAVRIENKNIEALFASFQIQYKDEVQTSSKEIALVEERERLRRMWLRNISKMPSVLPRLVIQCLIKHVIILNDPKTINNTRRISREFKSTIESKPFVNIITLQNWHRKYSKALELYTIFFGDMYTVFFNDIEFIYDQRIKKLEEKLEIVDKKISNEYRFYVYHCRTYKGVALKRFYTHCSKKIESINQDINDILETL